MVGGGGWFLWQVASEAGGFFDGLWWKGLRLNLHLTFSIQSSSAGIILVGAAII